MSAKVVRLKRAPALKQATPAVRDVRGFMPLASGGRVRRIPVE